jgi:hypothetical protein
VNPTHQASPTIIGVFAKISLLVNNLMQVAIFQELVAFAGKTLTVSTGSTHHLPSPNGKGESLSGEKSSNLG